MAIQIPPVKNCEVLNCAYNQDGECCTAAITVGDSHPMCDSYINQAAKAGMPGTQAGVGSCKVSSCMYNKSLECSADGITVGMHSDHADCMTYVQK